jgi:hypothetical protein
LRTWQRGNDYSHDEIKIYYQAKNFHDNGESIASPELSLDITPGDMRASEEVKVSWYL